LTKDWSFGLYDEGRNDSLLKVVRGSPHEWDWESYDDQAKLVDGVTLPADTVLIVSRVFVRSGQSSDYDSITFRIEKGCPESKYDKCRFWVKLADANKIECEVSEHWLE
jgi:hypothetical protein